MSQSTKSISQTSTDPLKLTASAVNYLIEILPKQQQGKCSDCELYFQDRDKLAIDHIIPVSLGGKDIYSNLQLLHRHCHVNKSRVERNHNAG